MSVPIAVSPAVVRYRRELLDALQESGFPPDQPPDIFTWARGGNRRAIILTLSTRKEMSAVARLQKKADAVVVVLLADPRPSVYRQVLAAGGFPVAWSSPPADVVGVLEAAINGQELVARGIDTSLTRALASNPAPEGGATKADATAEPGVTHPLDENELDILARVARGDTDRRIATALRVSERTVRRRLHMIFSKLGVASRIQAGIYAAKIGLAAPDVRPTVRGG